MGKALPNFRCGTAWDVGWRIMLIGLARGVTIRGMSNPSFGVPSDPDRVAFDRAELGIILSLYGRMVAAGEWRDYAMSFLREMAVFSVFRRATEHPLYRIEKHPRLRGAQGQYAVIGMDGRILKRGHDLRTVLRVLEKKLIRPVD